MAHSIQLAVDCHDPHALADWWAETLGWVVEPQDEAFIRKMIDAGYATDAETTIHDGRLVWASGAAIFSAEQVGGQDRLRMLFQTVPEGKTVKNRVHWDVRLDGEGKDEARARLEARGATFLWEASQGPHSWYTMADPEGNEFCIS